MNRLGSQKYELKWWEGSALGAPSLTVPTGMAILLGQQREVVEEARDIETQLMVARWLENIKKRAHWLLVYDDWGNKVLDTVVKGKSTRFEGRPLLAITEARAADIAVLAAQAGESGFLQLAWLTVDDSEYVGDDVPPPPLPPTNAEVGIAAIGFFLLIILLTILV